MLAVTASRLISCKFQLK